MTIPLGADCCAAWRSIVALPHCGRRVLRPEPFAEPDVCEGEQALGPAALLTDGRAPRQRQTGMKTSAEPGECSRLEALGNSAPPRPLRQSASRPVALLLPNSVAEARPSAQRAPWPLLHSRVPTLSLVHEARTAPSAQTQQSGRDCWISIEAARRPSPTLAAAWSGKARAWPSRWRKGGAPTATTRTLLFGLRSTSAIE